MISAVFLSGRLGEVINSSTRIVEVDNLIPGPGGQFNVSKIPVRSSGPEALLIKAKAGCLITLRGRLEADEKNNLYVIDEVDEIFSLPTGVQRL